MGNSSSSSSYTSSATESHGKSYHTKCIFFGCGLSDNMCEPALASDVRCCCFEAAVKVDPSQCKDAHQLCIARAGVKVGPVVVDATNPFVDKHELIVVAENKVAGC
mmetsp:Transcript_143717/g.374294  ORF Transcript_143717/g.374294 Transcript_143717/m.374294 type:complete len:106 (-) Transcript_143717:83-400(-)